MRNDFDNKELTNFLNNIELPDVQTPLHKMKLKRALLNSEYLNRKTSLNSLKIFLLNSSLFVRQHAAYSLAAITLFLTVAALSLMPFTSPAFAHIVLEVNPAMMLTIDSRDNVIAFESLDQSASDIFSEMDFRRKSTERAIEEIVNRLHELTILDQNNSVVLLIYPADTTKIDDVTQTLNNAESTVSRRLNELKAKAQVKSFALKAEVFAAADQAGLMPSQYARLLEHGMTSENLTKLFNQRDELEEDRKYFAGHFDEIAEQITKVLEKNVPEDEAVLVVREALATRRGTGEIRKAVQRLDTLIDDDYTPRTAIAQVRREMRSRRNLKDIDGTDAEGKADNESTQDVEGANQDDADQDDGYSPNEKPDSQEDEHKPSDEKNRRNLRDRQNERRLQHNQRQEQEQRNDIQEQLDEEPEQQDSENDKQSLSDEGLEHYNDRQNLRNDRQERRDEQQQRRNERRERRYNRQQQKEETLAQPDASLPLSDTESSNSVETDAEIDYEE